MHRYLLTQLSLNRTVNNYLFCAFNSAARRKIL